jgi:small subunit ribosomal protein S4e
LNRIAAPVFAAPPRKIGVWAVKPAPGRHPLKEAVSITVLLRDFLGIARDTREAERIIKAGEVHVDGKPARDPKMAVGLMDMVSVPKAGKSFRVLVDSHGRMKLQDVAKGKEGSKLCKIVGKRTVAKGATQVSLHDGRTLLGDKSSKVGDTIVLSIPANKVSGTFRLENGARCLITKGKHAGTVGKVKELGKGTDVLEARATLDTDNGEVVTVKKYLFAVGDAI